MLILSPPSAPEELEPLPPSIWLGRTPRQLLSSAAAIREECSLQPSSGPSQDRTVEWVSSPEEAAKGADVVVTTIPSEKWIVSSDWIEPGMHISAMGPDTKGRQEIDPALFTRAKIVVDGIEQCRK